MADQVPPAWDCLQLGRGRAQSCLRVTLGRVESARGGVRGRGGRRCGAGFWSRRCRGASGCGRAGAAGVHALGERGFGQTLALHFLGQLPGDHAGQRLGLGDATDPFGVEEFVERGAPVGVWCSHACICFMRRRARSRSAAALARVLPRTGTVNRGVPGLLRRKGGSHDGGSGGAQAGRPGAACVGVLEHALRSSRQLS